MNKRIYTLSTVITAIVAFSIFASLELDSRPRQATHADATSRTLRAIVIEDFEEAQVTTDPDGDGWFVRTNPAPFNNQETEKKLRQKNPVPALELKMINGAPYDLEVEPLSPTGLGLKKEKIMGVYFRFRYPGYNSVHFSPPKELDWRTRKPFMRPSPATGELVQERGIQLPGRAKAISMWVQGRGHRYNLEVLVKDYRGDIHTIHMGSINFLGWKPMIAKIPVTVPIPPTALPQINVTRFTEMIVRSEINSPYIPEMMGDTYVFFDQIKVLTDDYEAFFEGVDYYQEFENQTADK